MNKTTASVSLAKAFYPVPRSKIFPGIGIVGGTDFSQTEWVNVNELHESVLGIITAQGWQQNGSYARPRYVTFRPDYLWAQGHFVWIVDVGDSHKGVFCVDDISVCPFFSMRGQEFWVPKEWATVILSAASLGVVSIRRGGDFHSPLLGGHWNPRHRQLHLVFDENNDSCFTVTGTGVPESLLQA